MENSVSNRQPQQDRLSRQLNRYCREAGFGVVLPSGEGNFIADYVILSHKWTDVEKKYYDDNEGLLPSSISSLDCFEKNAQVSPLGAHEEYMVESRILLV